MHVKFLCEFTGMKSIPMWIADENVEDTLCAKHWLYMPSMTKAATHYREWWYLKIFNFYQLVREGYREITSDF